MPRSKVYKHGPAKPNMNMTPLIDVTFQIIIFFMLINNIVSEQSVQMLVPDLDDPQTRKIEEMTKVVINVAPVEHVLPQQYTLKQRKNAPLLGAGREEAGALKIGMNEYRLKGPASMSMGEALQGIRDDLDQFLAADPKIEVELRADCALYYEQVQLVMAAISQSGVKTVHLVAFLPEDQRRSN